MIQPFENLASIADLGALICVVIVNDAPRIQFYWKLNITVPTGLW
jgi:hypothetical protein